MIVIPAYKPGDFLHFGTVPSEHVPGWYMYPLSVYPGGYGGIVHSLPCYPGGYGGYTLSLPCSSLCTPGYTTVLHTRPVCRHLPDLLCRWLEKRSWAQLGENPLGGRPFSVLKSIRCDEGREISAQYYSALPDG